MIHFRNTVCSLTLLFLGLIAGPGQATPPHRNTGLSVLPADPVAGRYKLKALTVQPGLDFGNGPVTDMLAFTIKSGNPCISTLVVTFRSDGVITTSNSPTCQEDVAMGLKATDKWERSNDTLIITEADGKQTGYALSFNGNVMRLSSKTVLDGITDKKERQLTMELIRQ